MKREPGFIVDKILLILLFVILRTHEYINCDARFIAPLWAGVLPNKFFRGRKFFWKPPPLNGLRFEPGRYFIHIRVIDNILY